MKIEPSQFSYESDNNVTRTDRKKAFIFAVVVHLVLIVALFVGVQWKQSAPEAVSVELWSPPAARPVPPPVVSKPKPVEPPKPVVEPLKPKPVEPPKPADPPPTVPKKPDIVINPPEKTVVKPPDKPAVKPPPPEPKPVVKPPEPKPPPKVQHKFDQEVAEEMAELEKQHQKQELARQEELRLKKELDAEAKAGQAYMNDVGEYADSLKARIRKFTPDSSLFPNVKGNPEVQFNIEQAPDGSVLSVKLKKSSGYPAFDEAVQRAIYKASPLPKPRKPELFDRIIEMKFRLFE